MLPFAHMGMTVAVVRFVENRLKARLIDYRLLLVSSLLPDLIDKPTMHLFWGKSLFDGKAFGHSLAFFLMLCVFSLVCWFWWRKSFVLPTMALGVAAHDIFDVMWFHPGIFLWPLYGWTFPLAENEAWRGSFWLCGKRILHLYALEAAGISLLLYLFFVASKAGSAANFLRKGK